MHPIRVSAIIVTIPSFEVISEANLVYTELVRRAGLQALLIRARNSMRKVGAYLDRYTIRLHSPGDRLSLFISG